jgi:hypothetical protein
MEYFPLRQALHGHEVGAIRLHRQQQTGTHGFAVEENGTGAANAMFAAQVRALQVKLLAQEVRQGEAHFHRSFIGSTVHAQLDASL